MRGATQLITLYNYYLDSTTDHESCIRTQIGGVAFFYTSLSNISKEGFASADIAVVLIPEDAVVSGVYMPPKAFRNREDKTGYFTFAEGDILIPGAVPDEMPRRAELQRNYDNAVTIVGVADNRGRRGGHWEVTAK